MTYTDMRKIQKTTLNISGMHCASCDILVQTKLRELTHVVKVVPNRSKETIEITHSQPLSLDEINLLICAYGYKVSEYPDKSSDMRQDSVWQKAKDGLSYFVIAGVIIYIVNDLHLIPSLTADPTSGLFGVFLLGLIASISTCMATTGAILAGYTHLIKDKSFIFRQTTLFIVGRLISYAIFGFVLGLFGGFFAGITKFEGILNIAVAMILIAVSFDMLRLISLADFLDKLPILAKVKNTLLPRKKIHTSPFGALFLGGLTYFLPCGFSLSTQAYAMSFANPLSSSMTMFVFAIGTIPSLFALGFLSKIRTSGFYLNLHKIVGAFIFFVGLTYILNTLNLYGFGFDISITPTQQAVPVVNGRQIVRMTATSRGYEPNLFVIKKDIPVRWEIEGKEIFGCQGALKSPKAGVQVTYLKPGENIIEFIPTEIGDIQFSCSMGMFGGNFKVI
jgi:uncharacterized protein